MMISKYDNNHSVRKTLFYSLIGCAVLLLVPLTVQAGWKAGISKADITPTEPLWMAGYGGRKKPAEGTRQNLWIKVVALEDENGNQAIIMSSDLLGIPRSIYDTVCDRLQDKHNLSRAQIMLNSSHTHSGPVMRGALHDIYPLDENQLAMIEEYSQNLEDSIVRITGEALGNMSESSIHAGTGTTDFAVNRRENNEGMVPKNREKGNALAGPVDHSVPVLVVKNKKQKTEAIIFGYACHNTVMGDYKWHGDYAGYAQAAIEERHPGVTAMFYMGCGADQNPIPRREIKLLSKYGNMLADAVDEVLRDPASTTLLPAKLETTHAFVELDFNDMVNREVLNRYIESKSGYQKAWAVRLLKQLESGEPFRTSYSLPIQAWELGDQQLWLTMGGEVVVDYSLGFKKMFGKNTWVAGYCNDVPAYIPSLRVLEEDKVRNGYEGHTSMMVYGLPALRWADEIEDRLANKMSELVKQIQNTK